MEARWSFSSGQVKLQRRHSTSDRNICSSEEMTIPSPVICENGVGTDPKLGRVLPKEYKK